MLVVGTNIYDLSFVLPNIALDYFRTGFGFITILQPGKFAVDDYYLIFLPLILGVKSTLPMWSTNLYILSSAQQLIWMKVNHLYIQLGLNMGHCDTVMMAQEAFYKAKQTFVSYNLLIWAPALLLSVFCTSSVLFTHDGSCSLHPDEYRTKCEHLLRSSLKNSGIFGLGPITTYYSQFLVL